MSFIPLHVISGFSYLHSGLVAEKIPFLAKKYGFSSIGLSDEGTLSGYAPFYHSAVKAGVTPLFGMDAILIEGTFSLYVQNETGYRHLLKASLLASENKLTLHDLSELQEGLAVVYNTDSPFFLNGLISKVSPFAETFHSLIAPFKCFYLGIPYLEDPSKVASIREWASNHHYETIAFPKISYEKTSDAIVKEITTAIADKETLTTKEENGLEYFIDEKTLDAYYTSLEMSATLTLASSLHFTFLSKRGSLLHFSNNLGLTSEDYLKKLAYEGLAKRYPNYPQNYLDRLNYELSIINRMGYADYFLIVSDYVSYAKTHGVSVGPGRGSGPASLVAYALNISQPDPIKYGLLFERFLNPERQSMPDIDVDFSDVNRDIVVNYLQSKYGQNRVAHILTTQTIGAKEALRDIGRVYNYEEREINLIISSIANDKLSLRDDYRQTPQFKKLVDSDKYYLQIVALASKIEGLPRQAGLHAAGVLINDEPLEGVIPIKNEEGVGYVACLERDYLEEQGFLKMDLLGLRNLSMIDTCLALIKKNQGLSLNYEEIPYEDEDSIALIKDGKTMGLFQLESPGMKRAIREVKPSTFSDVAALLALFRPGPMESIPSFARRKLGQEKITYLAPELEPILKGTYGIIVYQEQIMQIAEVMAGFSLGEADLFRRAISHKDAHKLAEMKDAFIAGVLKKGHSQTLAEQVYELIYKFANYGFNKAHAVSYAILSCQMAYLKKHYPKEFYCSILDYLSPGSSKFKDTISEIKDLHLHLTVPSVNASTFSFEVQGESLLFPLNAIKNVQSNFLNALVDERIKNGPYVDIFDFASRLKGSGLTLPLLIRFIDAGAFSSLYPSRATLRASAPAAMNYAAMSEGENGQQALLTIGLQKPSLVVTPDDLENDLNAEYEALGMMVSGSPLSLYEDQLKALKVVPLADLDNQYGAFLTAGIIKSVRVITSRKGQQMAFLEVYDDISEVSFVLFSEGYASSYKALKENNIVLIEGKRDLRHEGYLANKVTTLGE